jgi:hypothetical protein
MGLLDFLTFGFGVALVVFVLTRLNSGLTRAERKKLTSTRQGE